MITSFGIVPFRKLGRKWHVLLIQHLKGKHWGFPKGRPEEKETSQETAVRELEEETGLSVERFLSLEPITTSYFVQGENKIVYYFPAIVTGTLKCQTSEILQAKWLDLNEAMYQITFASEQNVLQQTKKYIDEYVE